MRSSETPDRLSAFDVFSEGPFSDRLLAASLLSFLSGNTEGVRALASSNPGALDILVRAAQALSDPQPAGRVIPRDPDALLHLKEAAHLAGLSHRTFEKFGTTGGGPLRTKLGKSVRFRRQDVIDWMLKNSRRSTSDQG